MPSTDTLAPPALRAFLDEIIDYAGLFPPAGLPLNDALPRFARYRQGADAWMLARFILPTRRLPDLDAFEDVFTEDPPFRFSVLGTGGADADAFIGALATDLDAIRAAHGRHAGRVQGEAMEVRLPEALVGAGEPAVRDFLARVREALAGMPPLALFFELPVEARIRETAPPVLAALAAYNEDAAAVAGLKMRTGGLEPDAFPHPGPLAHAVVACRDAGVPFKATAGLHHPVRHYDAGVRAKMYGFLNVFGAAVMAAAHGLDEAAVRALLTDEDATHFRFDDGGFTWKDLTADADAVRRARRTLALSFGSCSFDEPRDDLRALGLL